jgi:hypothetical protein
MWNPLKDAVMHCDREAARSAAPSSRYLKKYFLRTGLHSFRQVLLNTGPTF